MEFFFPSFLSRTKNSSLKHLSLIYNTFKVGVVVGVVVAVVVIAQNQNEEKKKKKKKKEEKRKRIRARDIKYKKQP